MPFLRNETKLLAAVSLLCLLGPILSCGGGGAPTSQSTSLSGNWQIALSRHVLPKPPLIYTGFLIQSGNSITGSVLFNLASVGSGRCEGVGSVTGNFESQTVTLIIDELGESVSLNGTLSSNSTSNTTSTMSLTGEFSNLAGGCTNYTNTGTWIATNVAPLSGSFHGTFTSAAIPSNGTLNVTGTLTQGPNTGSSSATLTGTIAVSGNPTFCSYLSSATITGLISGTSVALSLYGPNGSLITQTGELGTNSTVTITPDAKSLTGTYSFLAISSSCLGDQGAFQLTFP